MRVSLLSILVLIPPALSQTVVEDTLLRPTTRVLNGNFGFDITALDDASGSATFAIGAPQTYPNRPGGNSGEVYVFSAVAGEVQLERVLTPPSSPLDASFGATVQGIPDVSGDGAMDLLVSAQREDVPNGSGGTTVDGGAVYLFDGATGALRVKMIDPFVSERFGRALGWVPDVTGDGVPDILTGSPFHDTGLLSNVGLASVRNGATGALVWQFTPLVDKANARFGNAVVGLEDINMDARGDVVIGQPGESIVEVLNGTVGYTIYSITSPSGYSNTEFGTSLARVADRDGDGISDYWVGAPEDFAQNSGGGLVRSGQVYLISGATGEELLRLKRDGFLSTSDNVGLRVESAGDLDQDGVEDVLVNIGSDRNLVDVFSGATGQQIARLFYANPLSTTHQFGYSFVHVGDLDENGSPDYAIGDYNFEERDSGGAAIDPSNAGAAYVYFSDIAQAELAGSQGWRLLSPPLIGVSYESLLGRFWTQGFEGADVTSGSANVFTYDETVAGGKGEGWSVIASQGLGVELGRGIAYYAFTDDDQIAPGTQGGFPKTLSTGGFAREIEVDLPVTFTESGSLPDDGWNLLGNPFPGAIDWGADGWNREGIDDVVYIYDAASETYQTWNGTTGTAPDGTIDPFEGFWVKAFTDAGLLVSVGPEAQTSASASSSAPSLILEASATIGSEVRTGKAAVMVHPDALEGHDALDAYALTPLAASYLSLHTLDIDGSALDINALPPSDRELAIPLDVWAVDDGSFASATVTLRWPDLSDLPADWTVTLLDTQTGTVTDLRQRDDYAFDIGSAGRTSGDAALRVASGPPTPSPLASSRTARRSGSRFILQIAGPLSVSSDETPTAEARIIRVQPNPVAGHGVLVVRAAEDAAARLSVFDALGREVAVLHQGPTTAGRHEVPFQARGLAAGLYVVRWQSGTTIDTRTITVIR